MSVLTNSTNIRSRFVGWNKSGLKTLHPRETHFGGFIWDYLQSVPTAWATVSSWSMWGVLLGHICSDSSRKNPADAFWLSGVSQSMVSWDNQVIHLKCDLLIWTKALIHTLKGWPSSQHGSIFAGLRREVENKCVSCQNGDNWLN